jgi:hypothetical protein
MSRCRLVKKLGDKLEPPVPVDKGLDDRDEPEHWEEIFDQLDEVGKLCVTKAFLETPEVGDGGEIAKKLRRRGYGLPEGEA